MKKYRFIFGILVFFGLIPLIIILLKVSNTSPSYLKGATALSDKDLVIVSSKEYEEKLKSIASYCKPTDYLQYASSVREFSKTKAGSTLKTEVIKVDSKSVLKLTYNNAKDDTTCAVITEYADKMVNVSGNIFKKKKQAYGDFNKIKSVTVYIK